MNPIIIRPRVKHREDGPWKKTIGIQEAVEKWLTYFDGGRKEVSRAMLRRVMRRFTEHFPERKQVRKFTRDDISRWVDLAMQRGFAGTYIKWILQQVKSFFVFAVEEGIMTLNPVQPRRLPNIPVATVRRVPFTFEQMERVLRVVQDQKRYHTYWYTACLVGYYTGLRVSDVAWLRWEFDESGHGSRINFDDEAIIVYPMKLESSLQRLEIPMEQELYNALLTWKNSQPPTTSPYIFPMMHGHWVAKLVDGYFRKACDEANLPEHSFHCFRHGFVTRLMNAGVDPIIIMSMTGQSLRMIQHYTHVSNAAKLQALEQSRLALHKARLTEMGVRTARPSAIEI